MAVQALICRAPVGTARPCTLKTSSQRSSRPAFSRDNACFTSRRTSGQACVTSAAVCVVAQAEVEAPAEHQAVPTRANVNRTWYPKGADAANHVKEWYVVDAADQTLGRLATLVASHIRGKHLPTYTPSMDMGAYVVVINAEKVKVSGKKFLQKTYYRINVGRPGSLKSESFRDLQARIPERIIEKAVKGMLPKGRIGDALFKHLKVVKGVAHPHAAQNPTDITHKIDKKPSELGPASDEEIRRLMRA